MHTINRWVLFLLVILPINLQGQDRLLANWEYAQREFGGMWDVWRSISYEGDVWSNVKVPHCFNGYDAVDPDVKYFQGEGWYRTAVKINNPYPGGRTLVHFEGVGQKASLYLYQDLVGKHSGGYDEFQFDITDFIRRYQSEIHPWAESQYGDKIPLAVCADNTRDLDNIPSDLSDFNLYGGMYRKVHLKYVPAISLDQVHIASQLDTKEDHAILTITPFVYNPERSTQDLNLSVTIKDIQGKEITQKERVGKMGTAPEISIILPNPILWSPSSPTLYTCEITLNTTFGEHHISRRFGIRSFEFIQKGPFHLNGKRLLLRGTHRHEDHTETAAVMDDALLLQEFLLMKEMGVNFIRLGHYQQSSKVLELCDSLGILVWEEIPWCRAGADSEGQKITIQSALKNLVYQHFNHPSIIIWGLGNEHDWKGEREKLDTVRIRDYMKEMHHLAHVLDASRKTAIRRCNFAKDIIDVYSPSIWAGWYRGTFPEYREVSRKEMEEVDHFLHVEWGASHFTYRHSEDPDKGIEEIGKVGSADEREGDFLLTGGDPRVSKNGDWSTTYACNLIDWHLKEQENMPWLTGTAYWPFKDFSTPLRPENPIPYVNQKGVLERDFTKKESYYVFQSYWTDKPMIHIYGSSWDIRWGKKEEEKLIKVYSNCEEVELWVNGISLGKKKRNSQDFPATGLRWNTLLREGANIVIAKGKRENVEVQDTLTLTYQTKPWKEPHHLTLKILEEKGDSVMVEARIWDKFQVQCLDSKDFVLFGLIGKGQLLDNRGTSTGSRRIALANGRARIWVQRQGATVVSVQTVPKVGEDTQAPDIPPVFLQLK
ncbi:MAG: glycoside hydrolase family 2 TIM barrel-domain containing protein [Bacteroidota bacterium]